MMDFELVPTDENIKNTLIEDAIGRNEGVASFIRLLNGIKSNSVIAIDDTWGNGKTFFVKQVQLVLKSYTASTDEAEIIKESVSRHLQNCEKNCFVPVYYDAWSNDNDYEPVLSIIHSMLKEVIELKDFEANDTDWLKLLTSSVDLVVKSFGGPSLKGFLTDLKSDDPLSAIKKQKALDKLLNDIFDVILGKYTDDTRIVFFIDELDRCCPNYAVRMLERIKHYFIHEKVIFVFSVNIKELQHTIKCHYGDGFDATKYLTRFFNFLVSLPTPNFERYHDLLEFRHHSYIRDHLAYHLMEYYNFSLRDRARYLELLRTATSSVKEGLYYEKSYKFYVDILVPFLLGLKLQSSDGFYDFINGVDSTPFVEFMQAGKSDLYCGILLKNNETFMGEVNDKELVDLKERFDEVYKCLFYIPLRDYSYSNEVTVGQAKFLSLNRNIIMDFLSFKYVN